MSLMTSTAKGSPSKLIFLCLRCVLSGRSIKSLSGVEPLAPFAATMARNITDHKRPEEALRKSDERFRWAIKHL